MSIVRYTNKKTGAVMLYEATSYYDPETKQSHPKRKYLGIVLDLCSHEGSAKEVADKYGVHWRI